MLDTSMPRRASVPRGTLLALWLVALLPASPAAAEAPSKPDKGAKADKAQPSAPMEFEEYQLILLRRGPKALELPEQELNKIQEQHLAHMKAMADKGLLVIAGPFGHQQDESFRGLCLYRTKTLQEARALAEADPAVKAGRLVVEAMTWYVEKGYLAFPKAPPPQAP